MPLGIAPGVPEAATSAILSVTKPNMPKMERGSQDTGGNAARPCSILAYGNHKSTNVIPAAVVIGKT